VSDSVIGVTKGLRADVPLEDVTERAKFFEHALPVLALVLLALSIGLLLRPIVHALLPRVDRLLSDDGVV
jgi:hypothetical protein